MSEEETVLAENQINEQSEVNVQNNESQGEEHSTIHTPPIQPPVLFTAGNVPISNALMSSLIVTVLLFALIFYMKKRISLVPGRLQLLIEGIISFFYDKLVDVYGDPKLAKRHAAIIMSFFFFIFIANQLPLLPLMHSLKWEGDIHFTRPPSSHLSFTLALAITSLFLAHFIGILHHKFGHIDKYIRITPLLKIRSLKDIPNALFEVFFGLLELVGEFAKILSLSARLFGNIFAHEIIVAVIVG